MFRFVRWSMLLVLFSILAGTPRSSIGATSCVGDCSESGHVTLADLITGVNIALGARPVSLCPAFDDGDGTVGIDTLVAAVRNALDGCPRPTPTATPDPDPVLSAIQLAFGGLCGPAEYYYARTAESGYEGFCSADGLSSTNLGVERFEDVATAADAFTDTGRVGPPIDLAGLPATYWERGYDAPYAAGTRSMVWQLGCWVVTVYSSDQNGREALAPPIVSQAIFDAAAPLLIEHCAPEDPVPTPTATKGPGPDLVVASIGALANNGVCQPYALLSVCVANAGTEAAGEFSVSVAPGNDSFPFGGVAAGGEDCALRPLPFRESNAVVTVETDAGDRTDESDETNNALSKNISHPYLEATCRPTRQPTATILPR